MGFALNSAVLSLTITSHIFSFFNKSRLAIFIARNVTEGPATRAGVRSTLKTVDQGTMMAEEEKIAVVAVIAVKKN